MKKFLLVAALFGSSVLAVGVAAAMQSGPPPAPKASASSEEVARWKQEFTAWAEKEGKIAYLSGPKTAGKAIPVNGKVVQLPANAYVEYFFTDIDCAVGKPCPETPVYRLKRGQSTIDIEARTGMVWGRALAPGQEKAFDFLDGVVGKEANK